MKIEFSDWKKYGDFPFNYFRKAIEPDKMTVSIGLRVNKFSSDIYNSIWLPIIIGNGKYAKYITPSFIKCLNQKYYHLEIDQAKNDIDRLIIKMNNLIIFI